MAYRKRPDRLTTLPFDNASYNPQGQLVVGPARVNLLKKQEMMESDDDPTNRSYKPVDHIKCELTGFLPGSSQRYWRDGSVGNYTYRERYLRVFVTRFDPVLAFQSKLRSLLLNWLGKNPVDWDVVARTAIPSLRNKFNTINFLAELDDIPDLLRSAIKNYRNLRQHKVFYSSFKAFEPDRMVSDITSVLTDSTLAYNLGVMPLIYDAQDLAEMTSAFFDKAQKRSKQIERYLKEIRKGIRCTDVVGTIPVDFYHESDGTNGGIVRWSLTGAIKVRATCKVIGETPIDNPLAVFLDNAGIYPDLHTLWNAVPFSFLFDYISPIGATLEREYGEWSWQTSNRQRAGLQIIDAVVSATFQGNFRYQEWGTLTPQLLVTPPTEPYAISGSGHWRDTTTHEQWGTYRWYHRLLPHDPQIDGTDVNLPMFHLPYANNQQENLLALLISPFNSVTRPSWVRKKQRRIEFQVGRLTDEERLAFVRKSLIRVDRSSRRRRK